jgi:acetyl esterase/lipase
MNDTLRLDPSDVTRYSPATLPLAGTAPFDVAYGARELPAYREDGAAFHRALREAGVASKLLALEGHHHHSVLDELFSADGKLVEKLAALAAVATTPRGGTTA